MSDDQDQAELRVRFAQMQIEHEDLKAAIEAMVAQRCDPLRIQRLKKKKLEMKDRMERLSSQIIPDIIA